MTDDIKHKRSKYSLEFKQDAASQSMKKGYSQQQAADHLGISFHKWDTQGTIENKNRSKWLFLVA
jgi:transposase-like protein